MSDSKEYREGYKAYENGWTTDSCHYPEISQEFEDWMEGWNDAQETYQSEAQEVEED